MPDHRAPRRAAGPRSTVVTALTAVLLLFPVLPATATPLPPAPDPSASSAELQQQVEQLTTQVRQLEVDAEVAVESWNEVRTELDTLITQEIQAQTALDDAGWALQEDRDAATRRVRALYRSGGGVELAWTALNGPGFTEVATTYRTARSVIDSDAAAVVRAREGVEVAVTTSGEVQRLRRERSTLEVEAEQRHATVENALLARENLLVGAGEALAAAVERERKEAEEAAIAAALARAAAEQAAAQAAEQAASLASAGLVAGSAAEAQARAVGQAQAGHGTGTRVPAGVVGADKQAIIDRAAAGAPSVAAATAIRAAATRLGMPYVWGATGPGTFDCSGLTGWAYRQAGVGLPRTSRQQYAALPKVDPSRMLPGDLLFYANGSAPGSIHHVSIYLGDGLILTAPRTGDVVKISALWSSPVYGAVRPAG